MCEDFSDEMIDMFAMGKLYPNDELVRHLQTCPGCRERVEEAQAWVDEVRKLQDRNTPHS
jgi:anti-sigma factor RsiW